jgi:hypothetical protein
MSSYNSIHLKFADFIIHVTKRVGATVTFLTRIWGVLGSNLGQAIDFPD